MEEDVEVALDEGVKDMLEYKDDGYIELVLKLLARICDGQHTGLQVSLSHLVSHLQLLLIIYSLQQAVISKCTLCCSSCCKRPPRIVDSLCLVYQKKVFGKILCCEQ